MSDKIARIAHGGAEHWAVLVSDDTLEILTAPPYGGLQRSGRTVALAAARLLPPVPAPRLIGVGLNYMLHAKESNAAIPQQPMLFHLPSTAVIAHGEQIVYPREGKVVQYEGELAVVIGKKGRRLTEANALDHVLGYTIGDDISERVIQKKEMANGAMLIGKGFDTFKPLGPWIATGLDPSDLHLETRLNGKVVQSSSTSDLIFPVPKLLAYISAALTLLPGDVIITGTPSGVGDVHPGDVVEIEIQGIGVLRNAVVAEG